MVVVKAWVGSLARDQGLPRVRARPRGDSVLQLTFHVSGFVTRQNTAEFSVGVSYRNTRIQRDAHTCEPALSTANGRMGKDERRLRQVEEASASYLATWERTPAATTAERPSPTLRPRNTAFAARSKAYHAAGTVHSVYTHEGPGVSCSKNEEVPDIPGATRFGNSRPKRERARSKGSAG